ncbi:MAG: hypothetical protein AUI14_00545 [Actinobacteria bacterium 13_2_20CM_2_71_6]|nr:MAG: hypothetical protein AUI14_00545 [Actinobacteria bacterium 13_2_20CM_2_71_6]
MSNGPSTCTFGSFAANASRMPVARWSSTGSPGARVPTITFPVAPAGNRRIASSASNCPSA